MNTVTCSNRQARTAKTELCELSEYYSMLIIHVVSRLLSGSQILCLILDHSGRLTVVEARLGINFLHRLGNN